MPILYLVQGCTQKGFMMKTKTISINPNKESQIGLRVVSSDADSNNESKSESAILTSLQDYCDALDSEIEMINSMK